MKKLNINAVRIDGGTQPRERIDMDVVGDYAEAVKVGIEFPPVIVFHDGAEHWLADGFHRWHAHKQAEKASILADVRAGSLDDAKLFASGCNGDHGLRRSNADKRLAVLMAVGVKKDWSDTKLATHCAVSVPFVSAIRRPEVAAKQQEQRATSAAKTAPDRNPITPLSSVGKSGTASPPAETFGPSDAEIAAAQRDQEEELASLRRIAESDDKLKAALAEVNRFREENRVLKERVNSLLNEKNAAIRAAKSWQRKAEAATA